MAWKEAATIPAMKIPEEQELVRLNAVIRESEAGDYKVRLYYCEKGGVTAVLTEKGFKEAHLSTKLNKWEYKRGTLFPARQTYVFTSNDGGVHIRTRVSRNIFKTKVAGSIEDLTRLVSLYNIELIEAKEIFVPWFDTAHLDYVQQLAVVSYDCAGTDLYRELVASQFRGEARERLLAL